MKAIVYGAGAIGGTTGAALARAGHDVLLVDSHKEYVEAINAHGLTVERDGAATTTRVAAVRPGRILHGGQGAFILGELDGRITPRVRELAGLLSAFVETPVTDNIWGYKWGKLIYGALLFGTAIVDAHVYEVVEAPEPIQRVLVGIVGEGLAVADKAGCPAMLTEPSRPGEPGDAI